MSRRRPLRCSHWRVVGNRSLGDDRNQRPALRNLLQTIAGVDLLELGIVGRSEKRQRRGQRAGADAGDMSNFGRVPASDQPTSNPAPNAPSDPPPEIAR
jgi:hypothetical protein